MRFENTKWGSRIVTESGSYISFAWKAYLLVLGIFVIIAILSR